jgi:SAM-dependent methyltransferase
VTDDRWEHFAQVDAEYYVLTDIGREPDEEGRWRFFASGEAEADRILTRCEPHLGGRDLAIEIGCGVGRVAIPISRNFGRVLGVDVAPTMLGKLRENAAKAGALVEPVLAADSWDERERADLAYSVLVFQHLPAFAEIAAYVHRVAQALKPTGIGYLQFDTRPATLAYRARNVLPDAVLPRRWRRGLRRIRRSAASLRELFREAELEIVAEAAPDSEEHVFIVRRT